MAALFTLLSSASTSRSRVAQWAALTMFSCPEQGHQILGYRTDIHILLMTRHAGGPLSHERGCRAGLQPADQQPSAPDRKPSSWVRVGSAVIAPWRW